jgi:hypothetical protein
VARLCNVSPACAVTATPLSHNSIAEAAGTA